MSLPSIPSFVLSGLLLICLPFSSFASATTSHISFSYAARQRMQNRARLLKQYQTHLKKQASYIVEGNAESRRALRQHNREQIKQHPEWFPARLKASDRRWQALAENNHFLSSDHLHNITEVAIHRLEQQLGKPYVWGGTRPDKGFDCSGLVFYASFTPHPAVVRRCLMRRWRVLSCLRAREYLRAAFPLFHHLIADLSFSSYR
ncbi:NlpC/P60 family protein [Shigella dysenteriae 1617]|uniref:NlpC/P60 family protein n=1 Tax=Shigella dysenteriae 1617 TaxID=754093 RepID=A0A0A6ZML9_SHIDY|nr:NlpC/P60 family protein [Shigella dysenteriae 1617]